MRELINVAINSYNSLCTVGHAKCILFVRFKEGSCLSDPLCLLDSSVSVNWLTDNSQAVFSVQLDCRLPAVSGRSRTSAVSWHREVFM